MQHTSTIKWLKIADTINEFHFENNNLLVTEAGGEKITLAKHHEQIFAFVYKCPHAGGILADGFLDARGNVVCPLHRYRYSISNGRNTSGEGYYLKTYPVELREDGVFIGFPGEKNIRVALTQLKK